ncbi:MAG: NAD(P)-dependent oxidoreductase [Sphingomonadaceae bacterium]
MQRLFIFGLGYTAQRVAARARAAGWHVDATGSAGNIDFGDAASIRLVLAEATHVLASVPPLVDGDPVLDGFGDALSGKWLGYLSSTGVYGDVGGAWVDESALVRGRRASRNQADTDWLARGARVFRLPGIYGPGRSALERVAEGKAHRVDLPGQVFSRVHVDDIAAGVVAAFGAPPGAYNLADDWPCDQNAVIAAAAALLGLPPPPFVALESLSPMARSFYGENRRVANGKAKRVLGWAPAYPDFTTGLRALSAMSSPPSATIPPPNASSDQR